MELTQDKIDLISKIIKSDRKYSNNEDLYDDFFNETCKRSAAILDTLENSATLETYLRRVVTTSILNVLKDSGRLRRSRAGYEPVKQVPFDTVKEIPVQNYTTPIPVEESILDNNIKNEQDEPQDLTSDFEVEDISSIDFDNSEFFDFEQTSVQDEIIDNEEKIQTSKDYSNVNISYSNIELPPTPEDVAMQKEALEFIADTIRKIDVENEKKEYLKIYTLRYDKGMTQKEIAQELGISQPEVSKRLFALIGSLKDIIEN